MPNMPNHDCGQGARPLPICRKKNRIRKSSIAAPVYALVLRSTALLPDGPATEKRFSDAPDSFWSAGTIPWITVDGNTTHYELAQMMYLIPLPCRLANVIRAAREKIADYDRIEYYQKAILSCCALSLTTGKSDGLFDDTSSMSLAQGCIILYRLADDIDGNSTPIPAAKDSASSSPVRLTNGKAVTAENVQELIDQLRETKYPFKRCAWTDTQCAKFAYMFSDDIFGALPVRANRNAKSARLGDIIDCVRAQGITDYWSFVVGSMDDEG